MPPKSRRTRASGRLSAPSALASSSRSRRYRAPSPSSEELAVSEPEPDQEQSPPPMDAEPELEPVAKETHFRPSFHGTSYATDALVDALKWNVWGEEQGRFEFNRSIVDPDSHQALVMTSFAMGVGVLYSV